MNFENPKPILKSTSYTNLILIITTEQRQRAQHRTIINEHNYINTSTTENIYTGRGDPMR